MREKQNSTFGAIPKVFLCEATIFICLFVPAACHFNHSIYVCMYLLPFLVSLLSFTSTPLQFIKHFILFSRYFWGGQPEPGPGAWAREGGGPERPGLPVGLHLSHRLAAHYLEGDGDVAVGS